MAAHARNLFSGLDGVDRDVASSIEWNEKAVRRGHRPAGVHLAVQIRLGLLPGEPDHGRAVKLLSDALGADSSKAPQFFLGCALLDGLGIECDQARGTEMIASALRCETFSGYGDPDCVDALSSATPSGIPWESSALLHGLLAESGFGRVRNVEAARRCYLEAIEQRASYATHAMARLAVLAHGAGDNAQAVDWLHKALAGAQPMSQDVFAAVQELRDVIALDERLQALCGDVAVVSRVEIEQAATFTDGAFVFESESDVQPSTAANEVNEEDATFAALTRLEVYDDGDLMSEIDVPDFDDFSDDADEDEEKTSSKQKKKVKVKVKVPS